MREGERIIAEACAKFGVEHARCVHRVGSLGIGDLAVWVGASARASRRGVRACRYIIDEVKHRVPIWKKEHYVNGDSGWVNCERCATAPSSQSTAARARRRRPSTGGRHAHVHHRDHDHGAIARRAPATRAARQRPGRSAAVPDYSRQMTLREVGAAGQARLRASTVAVVGAGGLGVPVLQYLAGAGVGRLRIIDGDRLEPSNLHRQTWYALADCGRPKAEARRRAGRRAESRTSRRWHIRCASMRATARRCSAAATS